MVKMPRRATFPTKRGCRGRREHIVNVALLYHKNLSTLTNCQLTLRFDYAADQ